MSDIDELHTSLLRTNAKCMALETLCLSLFKHHTRQDAVIAQFVDMKEQFAARALGDDELLDPAVSEMIAAHEHVYSVGIHRLLRRRGHECWVVSPGMTPRTNADRVKTDRRDCLKLARLARAGELTPIYVPDARDEAVRDLVRAREDAVITQRQVRQRLGALLLRNDIRYSRKTVWTPAHRRWIAELKLPYGAQQIAFEEYVQAVDEAGHRIERLEAAIREELCRWRWASVVEALQAFRGIRAIHAVRLVAELGDLARFASARHLMGYLGLVPSEHSTGERRRQGAITKTGNSSARRALVEAAWAYRYGARVSVGIARRQTGLPKAATDLAWRAQLRLCARFRRLSARGLHRNKIVVAVARELSGFVWALGQQVKPA